ncbi:hypothetical protein ACWEGQ_00180 [Streptomyces seoulensis]
MPDTDPGYVDTLAGQLRTRHPDLLKAAENELQALRGRLATVTRFIHNPAIAHDIRASLARDLGLPEPTEAPQ